MSPLALAALCAGSAVAAGGDELRAVIVGCLVGLGYLFGGLSWPVGKDETEKGDG